MSSDLVMKLREYGVQHASSQNGWGDPYDPKDGIFWAAADTIEALEGEVARLNKAHNERLKQNTLERAATHKQFHRAEAAEARAERLRVALEFYADENNWRDQPFLRMDHLGRECEDLGPAEVWNDNGDRARKALEDKQ